MINLGEIRRFRSFWRQLICKKFNMHTYGIYLSGEENGWGSHNWIGHKTMAYRLCYHMLQHVACGSKGGL